MAISADGNTLVVGASGEQSGATGVNGDEQGNSITFATAIYLFSRTSGSWQQEAYDKPSSFLTNNDGVSLTNFTQTFSLSSYGDRLVVARSVGVDVFGHVDGNCKVLSIHKHLGLMARLVDMLV